MKSIDATSLTIKIKEGSLAPRYADGEKELITNVAIITKEGMQSNKPLVDLQLTDAEGNQYFTALSGAILINLAAVIKGVGGE